MSKTDAALTGVTLLALAGTGWWLMDGWIVGQGWAAWTGTGNKWAITATGWQLFGQAWPVALAGAVSGVATLWPVLAWATRRRAEADLARRRGDIERQRQALDRKQQAIEQDKRESQARLDASRQELNDIHTRRLAEIETGAAKARITQKNALARATEEAEQARAEANEDRARADMLQKRLESEEKRRKNAVAASTRLRLKHRPERPKRPKTANPV